MRRFPIVTAISFLAVCSVTPPVAARARAVEKPSLLPRPAHVLVVILENQNAAVTIAQPFQQQLAAAGAYLANYNAITHPSQPNYFALVAGDTFGTNDAIVTLDVSHLGDLLEARGLDWKVYAEDYPGNCFLGATLNNGLYVRRHVPFLSFANVQQSAMRCGRIVNATQLDADIAAGSLPAFALYVPNDTDNGHDTGAAVADQWLQNRFGPLLTDARFTTGTLLVVTCDETTTTQNNLVATILWGYGIRPGATSAQRYDHYSLLRTLESLLNIGTLQRNDAIARVIDDVWILAK